MPAGDHQPSTILSISPIALHRKLIPRLGQEEHAARTAGVTVSFVLVLLVPLALVGLLIGRGVLMRRMERKQNDLEG